MYMCVKSYQHDPHKVSLTIRKFGLMNLLFPHPHKVELLNVVYQTTLLHGVRSDNFSLMDPETYKEILQIKSRT